MEQTLRLGPIAISFEALIWMVSFWIAFWLCVRISKRHNVDLGRTFSVLMLIGIVSARLGFVLQAPVHYAQSPLSIFNIRDGGWSPWSGFIVTGIFLSILAIRHSPKFRPLLAGTLAVLVVGQGASFLLDQNKPSTTPLETMTFVHLDGTPTTLNLGIGKATVINLWASWCPPCVREMPALEQAQNDFPDVEFVFLNQGENPAQITNFLNHHNLQLDHLIVDPRSASSQQYSGGLLPTTLFIDAQGQIQSIRMGELSLASLAQRLRDLVSK
ncbi:prolipoprotein diacylglyceryl transferase family protein [Orrella sp. 11846]|uniref:prolipoprotein diacylglyceryl transferase family protein n=1 Tax=Orrella sp. 11846 TaxID=3409913 RepID=UPI003B5C2C98